MSGNPHQLALQNTFEGFNFNRPQNTNKSAKDAFADLSKRAPVAPIHDKAALGSWFDQHIAPGMNALGHKVTGSAMGDKFSYGNHEGNFTVDFGRGAGAPGGALAWQAEASDAATRARYPQAQGQGHRIGSVMPGQSSDLMEQILASLQMQQPDPQALLLQQLL